MNCITSVVNLPKKKPGGKELAPEEKARNREIVRIRNRVVGYLILDSRLRKRARVILEKGHPAGL